MSANDTLPDGIRVLLVEDDKADAELVKLAMSTHLGETATVFHATLLSEALKLLTALEFDVVLLDLGLPDASGMTAIEKIKRLISPPPIVVLTGSTEAKFGHRALLMGAADFFVKTATGSDAFIARVVQSTVRHRRSRPE